VQIVAGDEIESIFGARLGLSTLAAAGLGNLVSDVIGLGMAEPVQVIWKPLHYICREPLCANTGGTFVTGISATTEGGS